MKKIMVIVAIIMFGITSTSIAETQKPSKLAKDLAEALGFQSLFDSIKAQIDKSLAQQSTQMMQQFRKEFSDIPADSTNEMEMALNEYISKVKDAWDPQEAANIYTGTLAELLPPEELQQAIDHYRTPQGKDELKVMSEAASRLNTYILNAMQKASAEGMQEYLVKIKTIVEKAKHRQIEEHRRSKKSVFD